ncbi:alpha/beta fold hydrolase [Hymenobacter sp. 15J16-1T3B]|uniref:alpha/beta hydrolase family protein n=1 Tax=Hymenobacter sp. 15J16-1T3B TaxID=2886941 RepID=UPI001D1244E2|nr:alpha/beta fold hydrolase [Hymenobacter sp. 15J16-1T3B]MCC3156587.1 alpha/beta fold hydrolase [Hymenobacter sp. 15J16-1T3B]
MRTCLLVLLLVLTMLGVAAPKAAAQELPRRPFVGIDLRALNDSLQQRYRLPDQNGVLVLGVRPGSSAEAAGLRAGDVVRRVDNTVLGPELGPFLALLKQHRAGDRATFTILRNGRQLRKPLVFRPLPPEQSPLYDATYSAVHFGPNRLRTIVTRPRGATGKVPLVLFIQGVGCFSIDNPLSRNEPTRRIIDSLSRRGYATLRVDKTGMGDSQGTPCLQSDLHSEAGGYKAALAAARQLDFVDGQRVFITGFSIGGVLAPLVAAGENVRGIVVFGTVSRTFIEYLLENKRNQSQLAGLPADSLNALMQTYAAALHLLLTERQTPEQVLTRYPAARGLLRFPQHYTYMQQWQALNLPRAWQQLDTDVLALRGAADYISYSVDHQLIADVVNRAHPGRARFVLLPEVDHHFNHARDMAEAMRLDEQANPPLNFEFMTVILRWLDERRNV